MNIAKRIVAYYSTEDFKDNYIQCLYEQYNDNKDTIVDNILRLFNVSNYETETELSNHKVLSREQAIQVYDFIGENLEQYTKDYTNYYVGYTSLASIAFGEQEEQLEGLINHKTGEEYNKQYLRTVFDKECFYVSDDNYAYYNLSDDGLHIDLLNDVEAIDDFIATI